MSTDKRSSGSTPTLNYDPAAREFVPASTPGNTDSARTTTPHANSAHSLNAAPYSTSRKAARPPLPLFSSDIWAKPVQPPIRSAGLPNKPTWDSFADARSALQTARTSHPQTQSSPHTGLTPSSSNAMIPYTSSGSNSQTFDGRGTGTRAAPGHSSLRFTQTQQYHNPPASASSSQSGINMSHTDPLPQRPFTGNEFARNGPLSAGSASSFNWPMPDTPRSMVPQDQYHNSSSDEQQSPGSASVALSDHYTKNNPHQAGAKGEVWMERNSSRSLRRALQDPITDWCEAYPGSVTILTAMNPEAYQMPYGTRVVNIKTEYPDNILRSIQEGKYSLMEKIAERIMQVWNAREDPAEKVLFLFSINGSKKFCGIAEMSGPWDRHAAIKGWKEHRDGLPCVGVFPLTWVFVKDVAYHQFYRIRQPHNHHSVGNMWNGMNFPSDVGRQVVEEFVKCPATSSILAYPLNYSENFGLIPPVASYSNYARRGVYNNRGTRGRGGRSGLRGGPVQRAPSLREHSGDHYDGQSDDEATPIATKPTKMLADSKTEPPKYQDTAAEGTALEPGKIMTITVNDKGQFLLVPYGGEEHKNSIFPPLDKSAAKESATGKDSQAAAVVSKRSFNNPQQTASPNNAAGNSKFDYAVKSPFDGGFDQSGQAGNSVNRAASFGAYGTGAETPTHRPAPHGGRPGMTIDTTQSALSTPSSSPNKTLSEYQLKAKFHILAAEQYTLQDQLLVVNQSDANVRALNSKLARTLAEKREVAGQLSSMGILGEVETFVSPRHDSFSSGEEASASSNSGYDVRAQDGRRLRSISKMGSPECQLPTAFDKAPGGSGRAKYDVGSGSESSDWHVKKSIQDLLKSPQKSTLPTRPAHETSSFFPENVVGSATRNAISFRGAGDGSANKPQSAGLLSSSFPSSGDKHNGMANLDNSPTKNFSFGGPKDQGARRPAPLRTPTSSFNIGAFGLGIRNDAPLSAPLDGGHQQLSFSAPGKHGIYNTGALGTPTSSRFGFDSFGAGGHSAGIPTPRGDGPMKRFAFNNDGSPSPHIPSATGSRAPAAMDFEVHDDGASDATDAPEKGVRLS